MTSERKIRVAIAGAAGKMGREAAATLASDSRFEVAGFLVREVGQARILHEKTGTPVDTDVHSLIVGTSPDVWLDFTHAESVVANIDACTLLGVRPVVGATGYSTADIARWHSACIDRKIGGIAAPNFAIGALLMIRFAKDAARFFPGAEIIELHHDGKKDAPSGTAVRTAIAMANQAEEASAHDVPTEARRSSSQPDDSLPARGLRVDGIHIHSVRLPGLVAHQEVIFGGVGETLTIRHDSLSRSSFMQGVAFACERVMTLDGMVYGLEHLLW